MASGPVIVRFPLYVPQWEGWTPADPDGDGVDKNWRGRDCPGFKAAATGDLLRVVTVGGGFDAARGDALHRAVDWMAPSGVIVRAPAECELVKWRNAGQVIEGVAHTKKGGWCSRLRDVMGWEHYFAHQLDAPRRLKLVEGRLELGPILKTGDTVEAGEWIGMVGRSGNAVVTDKQGKKKGCTHLHHSLSAPSAMVARLFARGRQLDYAATKVDVVPLFAELLAAGDHLRP